jgi:hypothetical protein
MKKATFFLLMVFGVTALFAQPIADASYTDCNSNTESIYGVLGNGKVLLVANAGTNCSICQGHAPGVASVADNNPSTIRVWGAITTKSGGSVNCSSISSWVSTYNWSNVFSFADVNKDWFSIGTPRYTVISPFDSTVAYSGSNWTTAKNTAENLANSIGLVEDELKADIYFANNQLHIEFGQQTTTGSLTVYNITGAKLESLNVQGSGAYVLNATLKPGIYFVHIRANGRETIKKILL